MFGAAIVSPGLPQIGPRQEQLRDYFEKTRGTGFDYAYRYPGMNKVLQAAGRVIRTPEDKGVVLLLDDRFAKPEYQRLFPSGAVRQHHNCQACRRFVQRYGGLVTVKPDGRVCSAVWPVCKLATLW